MNSFHLRLFLLILFSLDVIPGSFILFSPIQVQLNIFIRIISHSTLISSSSSSSTTTFTKL
ncbi:hypothetical protein BLOT_003560 [Blomia tropicalis]|nr:hypothetical protein BLOT_003560 [Blomia tropicalis]